MNPGLVKATRSLNYLEMDNLKKSKNCEKNAYGAIEKEASVHTSVMAEQDKKHKLLIAMIYFFYLFFTINSVLHISS